MFAVAFPVYFPHPISATVILLSFSSFRSHKKFKTPLDPEIRVSDLPDT